MNSFLSLYLEEPKPSPHSTYLCGDFTSTCWSNTELCLRVPGHRSKGTVISSPGGRIHRSLHRLWASAPAAPPAHTFLPFLFAWLMPRRPSGFSSEVTSSWKPPLTTPALAGWGSLLCICHGIGTEDLTLWGLSLLPSRSVKPEAVLFALRFSAEGRSGCACHVHPSAPLSPWHVSARSGHRLMKA